MSRQDVRTINELWQTSKCTRNNFDEDMLLDTLQRVRTARSNNMISDFDYEILDCYLTDSRKSKFYRMPKLDLFKLAAQSNKCHIQERNKKLDDMSEYYDNVCTALYRIIRKRRLTDEYDVYFLTNCMQ